MNLLGHWGEAIYVKPAGDILGFEVLDVEDPAPIAEYEAGVWTKYVRADVHQGAVKAAYASGVADAMNVIREHDFPFTERVDLIAERLAPNVGWRAVE